MDLEEKLKALAPVAGMPLGDSDWIELRAHLQMLCKQDALKDGFTSKYRPLSLPLDYVIYMYEQGRQGRLPREWVAAMHQLRVMKTTQYKEYLAVQRKYSAMADVFAPYEEMALPRELVAPTPPPPPAPDVKRQRPL